MNPLEFHGSNMDEDPQEFIDGIQKIVEVFGVMEFECVKLIAYISQGCCSNMVHSIEGKEAM